MTKRVVPMIHVPDVAATVDWYRNIGFTVVATYGQDGEGLSFAVLAVGDTEVMFNQGGRTSAHAATWGKTCIFVCNSELRRALLWRRNPFRVCVFGKRVRLPRVAKAQPWAEISKRFQR